MMSNHLAWRRCAACGQLTLVPVTAESCWQCGAPLAARPAERDDAAPNAAAGPPGAGSVFGAGFARSRAPSVEPPSAADLNLPMPRPRFMDLSPDDDLVACRLLESVFPDGVEL